MAIVEALSIQGGIPLRGTVAASGGKNAAVAILPAALLASSPCTIEHLPDVEDVRVLIRMFECLGAKVETVDGALRIDPSGVNRYDPPEDLAERMRASYYLVPVLLGLFGKARVAMPGGCPIGARPIDQTIKGWTALGARVTIDQSNPERGVLDVEALHLRGTEITLDMPSVGATVNTMLAAVVAEGNTTIHNAAREPHIVDVASFLGSMGAWVKGAGTDTIRIRGGRPLHGSTYAVIPDQIETGTLMIAAAATGGDVTITDAIPYHMESLSAKLLEMGVFVEDEDDRIHVRGGGGILRPIEVKTQVYPGFPTDLQQPLTAMLSIAGGRSNVTENLFEARFKYVDQLVRMGANIKVYDRQAVVDGVKELVGLPVTATDLRAGAALVVAGLIARGNTDIYGVKHIRRGYEHLDEKLRSLGAKIELVQREVPD